MAKHLATSRIAQCLLGVALLFGSAASASADQLILVCRSNVLRAQQDGSTGYDDSYKIYVDTTAQTEHTDNYPAPFPVAIDSQAIAGHYQNPVFPNSATFTRIDRTTGDYEFRQCDGSQCGQPPASWVLTDKGHCEKGEQRF
jgi:hypothetical protein